MAAIASSVPSSVPAAVTSDWLTVDDTAAQRGNGPAQYGGGQPVTNPVGGPSTESPVQTPPVTAPVTDGTLRNACTTEAAWPHVNTGYDQLYKQPPLQRQHGTPQGIQAARAPDPQDIPQPGRWSDAEQLQTYDQKSNTYSANGFTNNVPNNRVSARRTWGHSNPLDNPTWMGYSENPAQAHLAMATTDFTSYQNNDVAGYQFANGAAPDLWTPDGSSVQYETPSPPPTTDSSTVLQAGADPGSGWA